MHTPVLLESVIKILKPEPGNFFIDGTVNGGGHAESVINFLAPAGTFLGVDLDGDAIQKSREHLKQSGLEKIILVQGNYADLPLILRENKLPLCDGLLLDFGFSSNQIENSAKGFSFLKNEPLDMRYDNNSGITAASVIQNLNAEKLSQIFWKFGEERKAGLIAKKIVEIRRRQPITTTFDLARIVESVSPRRSRIHPATKIFQALRIFVNRELENIENLLDKIPEIVKVGGRAAFISFHSLEDRIVKNSLKKLAKNGVAEILTKKPIIPGKLEIIENPKSRSAKMRALKII